MLAVCLIFAAAVVRSTTLQAQPLVAVEAIDKVIAPAPLQIPVYATVPAHAPPTGVPGPVQLPAAVGFAPVA